MSETMCNQDTCTTEDNPDEDFTDDRIRGELEVDDALEHFLNSVGSKVKVRRAEVSKRAVYERRRTRYGAPSVNRRSYTEADLLRFERENDGFPIAATEEELRDFDEEVFSGDARKDVGDGRVAAGDSGVEVKRKGRSRSLSEVTALTKLLKLPHVSSPTRPKFLNRLISSAGLSKKCGGHSKKKAGALLLDCQDSSTEHADFSEDEGELHSSPSCTSEEHVGAAGYLQLLHDCDDREHVEVVKGGVSQSKEETRRDVSSPPTSPVLPGFVRYRCENFRKLSEERNPELARGRLQHRACSEDRTPAQSPRSPRAFFSPVSEKEERWVKSYYSFSRDKNFSKAVMSKGYVRALAEQINSGGLPTPEDDNDNQDSGHNGDVSGESQADSGQSNGCAVPCTVTGDGPSSPEVKTHVEECSRPTDSSDKSPTTKTCQERCLSPSRAGRLGRSSSEQRAERGALSPELHRKGSEDSVRSPRKDRERHGSQSPSGVRLRPKASSPGPKSPKTRGRALGPKPPVDYAHKPKVDASPKVTVTSPPMSNGDSPVSSNTRSSPTAAKENSASSHLDTGNTQAVESSVQVITTSADGTRQYAGPSGVYDNVFSDSGMTAQELFDMSWSDSDSDEFSDSGAEEEETVQSSEAPCLEQVPSPAVRGDKLQNIAEELLATERTYVQRLSLLHQVFYCRLVQENQMHNFVPSDVLNQMFSSVQSIHQFHQEFLLKELDERMRNWESERRIGDLMKKNAPFLKLYTAYIKNFDNAMNLINTWLEKSVKFKAIIHEIQKMPECGSLTLQHHMLEPIQRVPRYELLLKDYIKHLPDDSPDRQDAQDALDLVTRAACHSNEAMKKIEKFHKLLDIYQRLRGVQVDFISPTRDFVREGTITKISARSGEKQSRYLFLFNDLLLICSEPLMGAYRVRSELDVDGMEVKKGDNFAIPNTFLVHSKQKAIELLDEQSGSAEISWLELLKQVIEDYRSRKRSLRNDSINQDATSPTEDYNLGKQAPRWIPDDAATMCMVCQQQFTTFRRRHHCRACGQLICKGCSKKAPLEYMNRKMERVCIKCHNIIVYSGQGPAQSPTLDTSPKKKGVLQVKADDPGLLAGYLQISEDNGRTWNKRWFTLHDNYVMYFFRARQDVSAYHSLPLPGYTVETVKDSDKPHTFRIHHKGQKVVPLLFQADNDKIVKKWVHYASKLTLLELPDDSQRLSSQSNSSTASSNSDNASTPNNNNNNNCSSNSDKLSQADSGCPADSVCGDSVTDGLCEDTEENKQDSVKL